MRVLVTGASGFIGTYLTKRLLEKGYKGKSVEVRALCMPGEDTKKIEKLGVKVVRGDITRPETLKGIGKGCELVFHLAGLVSDWGPMSLYRGIFVKGTENILKEIEKDCKRYIHFSSFAVYGYAKEAAVGKTESDPSIKTGIPYCDVKIEGEALVKTFCIKKGMDYTIIRPSNVIGPGSVYVSGYVDAFIAGPVPLIEEGQISGSFVNVENLIDGVMLAAELDIAREKVYLFRDDYDYTWGEFACFIADIVGKKPEGNIPLLDGLNLAASIEEATPAGERPPLTRLQVALMGRNNDVNCTRAKIELGWNSKITIGETMRAIEKWVIEEYLPKTKIKK